MITMIFIVNVFLEDEHACHFEKTIVQTERLLYNKQLEPSKKLFHTERLVYIGTNTQCLAGLYEGFNLLFAAV